jgi:methionine sulfoxide reductase heme-binding subunit
VQFDNLLLEQTQAPSGKAFVESTPTFGTGLFAWLMGYRLLVRWCKTGNELPTWLLLVLSIIVAALTFIAEAIALGIQANVSPLRVLQSAFDFDMIRPGWLVLGAGLIVVAFDFVCARFAKHGASGRACARGLTRLPEQQTASGPMPARPVRVV